LMEESEGFAELLAFVFGERGHRFGQGFDSPLTPFPHQADAFGRRFEADAPAVFRGVPADQSRTLEAGDDAAHGGRSDLFCVGKLAKRLGAAKYEDGKSGKLGGADAAFSVADTEAAEQVNRGGVELIGDFGRAHVRRGDGARRVDGRRGRRSSGRGGRSFRSGAFFVLDRKHGR
jgi:hypothetical protein